MLIRSVALVNIRSYEELTLSFDEGITLLTGDIGAGKTTILAAIEFALFGLQRGVLDGDALLRHGADDGSVTLVFEMHNRTIAITRVLRRTHDAVRQTDGTLEIDGAREDLSAQELKARVLELLGYPDALLTKSKGLIFRHTVYTPQEEMKAILWLAADERLDTLRTLFGIERYKTIGRNAQLLARELRAEERVHLVHAANTLTLERDRATIAERLVQTRSRLADAQKLVDAATTALHEQRTQLAAARAAYDVAMHTEHERTRLTQRVRGFEMSHKNAIEDVANNAELLAKPLDAVEDCTAELDATRSKQLLLEQELRDLARSVTEAHTKRTMHLEQARTITTMATCPVCKQAVTPEHKHVVQTETDTLIAHLTTQHATAHEREHAARAEYTKLAERLRALTEQQRRFSGYQKELLARAEHERQRERFTLRVETIAKDLALARAELARLPLSDATAQVAYARADAAAKAAEELREERLRALRLAQTEETAAATAHASIDERLAHALAARDTAQRIQERRTWLEEHFLPAVATVESHVLASLHREFAELFTSHFAALIEDDTLTVGLGEQFEPLVVQNGYDASLEQLSGGEKTAVALSYRLALYRVVSDFIATITTKDLLILDEPTDGFSTEQLVRVRDVIRGLGCRQVILVSHEQGMESACDHVVRVEKRHHRSTMALA